MQVKLNRKIKYRESFRPFAPSVLQEDVSDYFELEDESPYMLLVENVHEKRRNAVNVQEDLKKYGGNMLEIVKQKRSDIPAVTHVDYSARIQTVTEEKNPYYYNVMFEAPSHITFVSLSHSFSYILFPFPFRSSLIHIIHASLCALYKPAALPYIKYNFPEQEHPSLSENSWCCSYEE